MDGLERLIFGELGLEEAEPLGAGGAELDVVFRADGGGHGENGAIETIVDGDAFRGGLCALLEDETHAVFGGAGAPAAPAIGSVRQEQLGSLLLGLDREWNFAATLADFSEAILEQYDEYAVGMANGLEPLRGVELLEIAGFIPGLGPAGGGQSQQEEA